MLLALLLRISDAARRPATTPPARPRRETRGGERVNKSIRKVAAALAVLMVALFVNLNFVQVVKGNSYRDDPQNRRVLLNEYASPRGDINVGGTAVAHSKATNDTLKYLRVYPQGKLYAPVTGFYSFIATPSPYTGTTGIESAENSRAVRQRPEAVRHAAHRPADRPQSARRQRRADPGQGGAARGLQNLIQGSSGQARRGAVVALDPKTGAILAAVSTPSYDPSQLSLHDTSKITKNFSRLSDSPRSRCSTARSTSSTRRVRRSRSWSRQRR